ncbi:hypothetical protein BAV1873, partial [Bordetella avium 197N]
VPHRDGGSSVINGETSRYAATGFPRLLQEPEYYQIRFYSLLGEAQNGPGRQHGLTGAPTDAEAATLKLLGRPPLTSWATACVQQSSQSDLPWISALPIDSKDCSDSLRDSG